MGSRGERGRPTSRDLTTATDALLHAYRGPFLGQAPESWALQARDHLRDRYLKSLEELGGYWEKQENWEMTRVCYERVTEIEATAERRV